MTRTALPVAEAAAKLGITASALRKRYRRGAASGFKDDSGRLHIYLETETGQPARSARKKPVARRGRSRQAREADTAGDATPEPSDKVAGNGRDQEERAEPDPRVTFVLARIEARVDELARALANVTGHLKAVTRAVEAHDDLLARSVPADGSETDAMGRLDLFEVRLGELGEAQASQEHMLTLLTHRIEGLAKLVTRAAAGATEPGFMKRLDEGLAELAGNVQALNMSLARRDRELDRLKRLVEGGASAAPAPSAPRPQPPETRPPPEPAIRPLRPGPPRPFGKKAPPGGGQTS